MPNNHPSKRLSIFALIAVTVLFLANSSNPPNGRTGAPGDIGTCAGCHGGSNPNGFNGSVEILNFPTTITPGTTYNLTARVNNPNGLANRGGFQAVVLNETSGNTNAGDLIVSGANPSTVFSGGREYVEHSPAINFPGSNQVTWDFDWEAPSGSAGDVIKIYTAAVIGNGSGSSGDFVVTNSFSGTMDGGGGGDPLTVQITSSTDVSCFGGNDGTATAEASDGAGSYSYSWSNGESGATATMLTAGPQSVTVTDANSATATASVMINQPSTAVSVSITNQTSITCNNTLGSATASGSGGTPGYTYLWDNGEGNATAVSLSAGMHSVTATDMFGCFAVTTVFINTDIAPPIADAGPAGQLDCNNTFTVLDGSASDSGGNISYLWTTSNGNIVSGATSTSPVVDMAGTYTITVSNNTNGCTASASTTVTEIPSPTLSISGNNLTCFDSNDGSITLSVNGGAMPFNFDWNDDTYDGIQNPTNIPAGTYAVTLTDGNSCVASTSVQITSPSDILLISDITSPLCNGGCDGQIFLTPTGGAGFGYTYNWANGDNSNPATGLCAGDISVTVTDDMGCSQTEIYTITEPAALTISGTTTDATCGECNGTITTTVNGGTGGYTFNWDGGLQPTANQSNVCPGTYTVTVTDNNNCTVTSSFTVNSASGPTLALAASSVSCNGTCDGSVSSSVSGGATPITFQWSNGSSDSSIDNLCAGPYSLTLTDANGCTITSSATVGTPDPITLSFTNTNPLCFESCDGTIMLSANGGNGGFTFVWSGGIAANEQNPTDLCAGTYSVTATDVNGCTNNATTTLTEPAELVATATITNLICNNDCTGNISLSVNGGTGNYTFNWSNDPSNNSSTNSDLCAGTYTVTITDSNGCSTTLTETITEPSAIQANLISTDETCNGECDGEITLSVSGGNQPYTFIWSNGSTDQNINGLCTGTYTVTISDANNCTLTLTTTVDGPDAITISNTSTHLTCNNECNGSIDLTVNGGNGNYDFAWSDSTIGNVEDPTNLCAGNYTVTVTDQSGCTASTSITITEPTALIANASSTNESGSNANDGSATANPTGGTGNYTFNWSNSSTNQNINSLSPGTYTVTVTDANNCTAVESVTVNSFDCNITTTISGNNILCNGDSNGSATVTASGGNGAISYNWSSGGNTDTENNLSAEAYTVTVTDADNCSSISNITLTEPAVLSLSITGNDPLCSSDCNGDAEVVASGGTGNYTFLWSNASTDDQINNLCAGSYSVTVSDGNNCTASINITITAPPALTLVMSATSETAPGASDGTVTANAGGGTSGYTEQWSNGQAGLTTITNLAPGDYCVTITDSNGCTISNCATVAAANCDLEITGTTNTNILCNGDMTGSLTANTTGGTNPITYLWSNTNSGQTINNLPAGNYSVTATDVNGCSATFNTSLTEPAPIAISVSTSNVICNGDCNGTATPTVTGGVEPYTYSWTPTGGTATELTDLCPDIYQLFIMDMNNCTASVSFEITEPTPVVATVTSTDETSLGANDGTANVESSGGTQPYSELWSNGATGISTENLAPGTYCVTITDFSNCTATNCTTVNGVSCDFTATISQTNISCNSTNNGSATVTISGGMEPFSYNWSSSSNNTNTETNLAPGTVTVTITDNLGCSSIQSVTITEPTAISLTFTSTDESSSGAMDGSITANPSGGTLPFTSYNWDTGANTQTINNLSPGSYCVTVTDANGCTSDACANVNPGGCTLAATSVANNVSCFDNCDGFIDVTIAGGTEPITYEWSNGATDQDISALCVGEYDLTITDNNNCQVILSAIVMGPSELIASATTTVESADGANDGTINLTINGGTPMYTYSWSNGETSEDLSNLSAGTYCVTVTDVNGCSVESCSEVTVFECTPINISSIGSGNTCPTDCNGTIDITVSGGDGNFSFAWSNGETTEDLFDLCNGNYILTVTDGADCTASQMVTISSGNFMINEAITTDVTCAGLCDGMITVTTSSGSGPFTYDWNVDDFDGMTELSDLCPGIYDLTVTDGNGCTELLCFDIDDADLIQMTFTTTPSCIQSPCNGTVSITTTGGTPPYEYSFDTDGVSFCQGEYDITVTDALGCMLDGNFTISEAPIIEVTVETIGNDIDGQGNGFFEILVSGGVPNYTFEWMLNGTVISTEEDPTGLSAGEYDLEVTDDNGCSILITDLIIDSTTPSSEPTVFDELKVFPNPANDIVHILLENPISSSVEIVLFDISGKRLNPVLLSSDNAQQWTLNVADLPVGVYTLQVKGDGFVSWEKLVLQR